MVKDGFAFPFHTRQRVYLGMPRPPKPRWYQEHPPHEVYKPAGVPLSSLEQIELHLDELEALRLCDGLGLEQHQAGERMGISRGTVQRLLSSARAKVADALANGKALVVFHPDHVRLHPGRGRHRRGRTAAP